MHVLVCALRLLKCFAHAAWRLNCFAHSAWRSRPVGSQYLVPGIFLLQHNQSQPAFLFFRFHVCTHIMHARWHRDYFLIPRISLYMGLGFLCRVASARRLNRQPIGPNTKAIETTHWVGELRVAVVCVCSACMYVGMLGIRSPCMHAHYACMLAFAVHACTHIMHACWHS